MHKRKNRTAVGSSSPADGSRAKRSWVRRALSATTNAALGTLAIGVLVAALGPITGWWHYEVVQSGSMTPALRVGGVALVRSEPLSDVHVGQILAFHPPGMKDYVRIHRVIAISRHDGQVWIRTKGDANNTADPGPIRLLGKSVYHETAFVPYAGYGAVVLYKHSTRVALTVVLFTLVIGGGLYLIWSGGEDQEESRSSEGGSQEPLGSTSPGTATPATSLPRLPHLPRRLAVDAGMAVADLSAEKAAEQAANASLLALNNIYNKPAPEAAPPERVVRLDATAGSGSAVAPRPRDAS